MDTSQIVAVVSICTSAVVAVLGILVPLVASLGQRQWEKSVTEQQTIREGTADLLTQISHFMNWEIKSLTKSLSGGKPSEGEHIYAERGYADLRAKFFCWEQSVNLWLDVSERQAVQEIRDRFLRLHTPDGLTRGPDDSDVPDLSKTLLSLSQAAARRAEAGYRPFRQFVRWLER